MTTACTTGRTSLEKHAVNAGGPVSMTKTVLSRQTAWELGMGTTHNVVWSPHDTHLDTWLCKRIHLLEVATPTSTPTQTQWKHQHTNTNSWGNTHSYTNRSGNTYTHTHTNTNARENTHTHTHGRRFTLETTEAHHRRDRHTLLTILNQQQLKEIRHPG